MLIAGAKKHAKEVLQILEINRDNSPIVFFDDISQDLGSFFYDYYKILRSLDEAKIHFEGTNSKFILALGNPIFRKIVADKLICIGGVLSSVVSKTAIIGRHEVKLGEGLNIMHHVMISNSVQIGTGTLINAFSSIHHDVVIGNYCEVSPHAVLLGGCTVGNYTSIGANATILPNIKVGSNVVVGSGSVVTKDVPDNRLIVGVPAVIKKELKPFV